MGELIGQGFDVSSALIYPKLVTIKLQQYIQIEICFVLLDVCCVIFSTNSKLHLWNG